MRTYSAPYRKLGAKQAHFHKTGFDVLALVAAIQNLPHLRSIALESTRDPENGWPHISDCRGAWKLWRDVGGGLLQQTRFPVLLPAFSTANDSWLRKTRYAEPHALMCSVLCRALQKLYPAASNGITASLVVSTSWLLSFEWALRGRRESLRDLWRRISTVRLLDDPDARLRLSAVFLGSLVHDLSLDVRTLDVRSRGAPSLLVQTLSCGALTTLTLASVCISDQTLISALVLNAQTLRSIAFRRVCLNAHGQIDWLALLFGLSKLHMAQLGEVCVEHLEQSPRFRARLDFVTRVPVVNPWFEGVAPWPRERRFRARGRDVAGRMKRLVEEGSCRVIPSQTGGSLARDCIVFRRGRDGEGADRLCEQLGGIQLNG